MKNRLFAIGAMILMMTSCTQDELISSDNGKEPATAGSCLTLVGLSSPQTRVSIGDKTGDVYPVLWSEGDALGVFSRTAGTDINNVQSLLSDESIGQNSGVFTSDDVKMAEEEATELLIFYPHRRQRQMCIRDRLKSVSLYDKETKTPLSGVFTADLDTDELIYGTDVKPYATVSLTTPELLASTQDIYRTTYPADLSGKEVYIVITLENDQQTVTIPILKEGKQLKANAVNTIAVNNLKLSDNSCEWYEPVETRLLAGGWAYGESNCLLTNISTEGVDNVINVKARGNFMEVEEPKYAKTILNCDLGNANKMVRVNGSATDITPVNGDYTITVTGIQTYAGLPGGCGQVAIYGADQTTVIWSFIIWMTPTPAEHPYGNTGYVVLDRNLGTYMTCEGDNWKQNGVYFQWGRPTPVGWSGTVGTNIPTEATNVRFSIENPRALLYTNNVDNTKSDWYLGAWTGARTDRKDDFWGNPNESSTYLNPSDGHKSIYDPCPKGYRVVSPRVLDEIEQKGEFVKQSATAVFKYCYDGTNYAYWPLAGCKWGSNGGNSGNNTGLDTAKGAACYWSNSSASSYGNDKDQGATSLYYKVSDKTWTHSSGRSHAFSVRCMKDTENR